MAFKSANQRKAVMAKIVANKNKWVLKKFLSPATKRVQYLLTDGSRIHYVSRSKDGAGAIEFKRPKQIPKYAKALAERRVPLYIYGREYMLTRRKAGIKRISYKGEDFGYPE